MPRKMILNKITQTEITNLIMLQIRVVAFNSEAVHHEIEHDSTRL